jgi:hypothetical protein
MARVPKKLSVNTQFAREDMIVSGKSISHPIYYGSKFTVKYYARSRFAPWRLGGIKLLRATSQIDTRKFPRAALARVPFRYAHCIPERGQFRSPSCSEDKIQN